MNRIPILTLLFVLAACQAGQAAPETPSLPSSDQADNPMLFQDGLSASYKQAIDLLPSASEYRIGFTIGANLTEVSGEEIVRYTNQESVPLQEVEFHLFPNILGGRLSVTSVLVDGKLAEPVYELSDSLMRVPLEASLQPGQSTTLQMNFTVEVPSDVSRNYGVLVSSGGMLTLAHSYPMVAVYDSKGWEAQIPSPQGDLTYSDPSFFVVKVTAPGNLTLVASGREIDQQQVGSAQTITFASGPARDFFLAAGRNLVKIQETRQNITINSYASDADQEVARRVIDPAFQAIQEFERLYAPYPYTQLNILATPTQALGIEYPGLIVLTNRIYAPNAVLQGMPAGYLLEPTVVHEVAHQWFYNLVGNDQLNEPWLDESMAQFATLEYYGDEYGPTGAQGFRQSLEQRWGRTNDAAIPLDLPVAAYQDAEYGSIIYGRGALFLEALQNQMGPAIFEKFIKDYVQTYSWRIATTGEFQSLAEKDCSCNLQPLFDAWVYPPSQ